MLLEGTVEVHLEGTVEVLLEGTVEVLLEGTVEVLLEGTVEVDLEDTVEHTAVVEYRNQGVQLLQGSVQQQLECWMEGAHCTAVAPE